MADSGPPSTKESPPVLEQPTGQDSEHGSSDYYIDPVKEKKMMRKFDVSQGI